MDYNTIAANAIAVGLSSLALVKDGVLKSIGSDIWELVKKPFRVNKKDMKIIEGLQENPNDLKLLGAAEYKLAEFLESNPTLAGDLVKYIDKYNEKNKTMNVNNSKNFVFSENNYGSISVGDKITNFNINTDFTKRDIDQLVLILEDRANIIVQKLQKYYKYTNVKEYLEEFKTLHKNHIKALSDGNLIYAHELLLNIYNLSYKLESDEFWTRHDIETPAVLYNLRNDAFTKGNLICAYISGDMKEYSEQYFSINVSKNYDELLMLYKRIGKISVN